MTVVTAASAGSGRVPDTVIAVAISGLLTLAGIWYTHRQTYRAAARTSEIESKKVDAAAYDRARQFDQQIVEGLRTEVNRLAARVTELRADLELAETARDEMRRDRDTVRRKLDGLERVVTRLSRLVQAADLQVPRDLQHLFIPPEDRQ